MESHSDQYFKAPSDERYQESIRQLEARICHGDASRLKRFLLDTDDSALTSQFEQFLAASPGEPDGGAVSADEAARSGGGETTNVPTLCGPFRLERELGQGGMGRVYLASRCDNLNLKVALKVLTCTLPQSRALFERECLILSSLKHANIAHVLDAGVLPSGQPWLAMEYVEGQTLKDWLRASQPDLGERIRLFLKLCDAVAHAHRQMIIHRDIKPNNIMVQADGEPKLLDFGIASTLDPDTRQPVATLGANLMTPEYASPEQVRGEHLGTASDVYSLGVVLYEMLTGALPHRRTANSLEMIRRITESPVARPSSIPTGDGKVHGRFALRLQGDLDIIVLKALERDVILRYAAVQELADDLRRYLNGLPIQAREAGFLYRFHKFARRNRWSLLLAGTLISCLLIFGIYARHQGVRLSQERDLAIQEKQAAEEITEFLVSIFERVDPNLNLASHGREVMALDVMEQGRALLEMDHVRQGPVRQRLMTTMGLVYRALGNYDLSRDMLERSVAPEHDLSWSTRLELIRTLQLADDYSTAQNHLTDLGQLLPQISDPALVTLYQHALAHQWYLRGNYVKSAEIYERAAHQLDTLTTEQQTEFRLDRIALWSAWGNYDRAIEALQQLLVLNRERHGQEHSSVAQTLAMLGTAYLEKSEYERADVFYDQSETMYRKLLGERHPLMIQCMIRRGDLYRRIGEYKRARITLEQAQALAHDVLGTHHLNSMMCLTSLGILAKERGDYDRAEALLRRALTEKSTILDEHHMEIAIDRSQLGDVFFYRGDFKAARTAWRKSLASYAHFFGDNHPYMLPLYNNIALSLYQEGDLTAAERLYRQSITMNIGIFGERHLEVATSKNNLALVMWQRRDLDEAESLFRETLHLYLEILGEKHPYSAFPISNLGMVLLDKGDLLAAESFHRRALQMRVRIFEEDHLDVTQSLGNLARLLREKGVYDEAAMHYHRAVTITEALLGEKSIHMASLETNQARLKHNIGDYDAAERMSRRALDLMRELAPDDKANSMHSRHVLAVALMEKGDYTAAGLFLREVLAVSPQIASRLPVLFKTARTDYGEFLWRTGDLPEAEKQLELSLANIREDAYLKPLLMRTQSTLARVRQLQGEFSKARDLLADAEAFARDHPNPNYLDKAHHDKARLLWQCGEHEQAEALLLNVLFNRFARQPDHPWVAGTLIDLAELLAETGRTDEALPLVHEAVTIYGITLPNHHELQQEARSVKGLIRFRSGHPHEGRQALEKSYEQLVQRLGADHWRVRKAEARLKATVQSLGIAR